ncbi:hypothetical protein JNW88_15945 [Micromonospora sp. ATA32]|nr:hypothetical protein [Micromonospora sp. ATA32]
MVVDTVVVVQVSADPGSDAGGGVHRPGLRPGGDQLGQLSVARSGELVTHFYSAFEEGGDSRHEGELG